MSRLFRRWYFFNLVLLGVASFLFFPLQHLFAEKSFDIPTGVTDLEDTDDDADDLLDEDVKTLPAASPNQKIAKDKDEKAEGEDSELSLSEGELRDLYRFGIAFNYGATALPWQTLGISGYDISPPKWKTTFFVSYGKCGFRDDSEKKSFSMNVFSNLVGIATRTFFSDVVPILFVQGAVGYAYWRGTVTPQSPQLRDEPESLRDKLSTSFSAHGPVVGANLGLATHWENGFYLEYTLVGMGYSYPISETASQDIEDAKEFYRSRLKHFLVWGISNITAGYFF